MQSTWNSWKRATQLLPTPLQLRDRSIWSRKFTNPGKYGKSNVFSLCFPYVKHKEIPLGFVNFVEDRLQTDLSRSWRGVGRSCVARFQLFQVYCIDFWPQNVRLAPQKKVLSKLRFFLLISSWTLLNPDSVHCSTCSHCHQFLVIAFSKLNDTYQLSARVL